MSEFVLITSIASAVALLALDFYIFRNWKRFVQANRPGLRWTLPVYQIFMGLMPLTLPVYFSLFRWWEVDPKLLRTLFVGFWVFYYLPRALVAVVLLIKDVARFAIWLFAWFQERLPREPVPQEPVPREQAPHPNPVPAPAPPAGSAFREAAPPAGGLDLTDMKRMGRSEFLRTMGWSVAAVPFVVTGYGLFRTLYDFDLRRVTVSMPGLPRALDGLTIGQLSDLHAGSFFSARPMVEAVDLLQAERPDLIVITGDFVNHDDAELERIVPALQSLHADLGVYGCLGNHDHYANTQAVADRLRATSVDLLVNAHRTRSVGGARVHVIGTDNTGFNQRYADLPAALQGIEPEVPGASDDALRLLLAHDPTFWDRHVRPGYPDIDLMLCGHTHGGQIGFEFGPMRWSLARVAYERWAGLYRELRPGSAGEPRGAQYLYVNRGLGTVGPPLRFGIRPEITLLTLRRA